MLKNTKTGVIIRKTTFVPVRAPPSRVEIWKEKYFRQETFYLPGGVSLSRSCSSSMNCGNLCTGLTMRPKKETRSWAVICFTFRKSAIALLRLDSWKRRKKDEKTCRFHFKRFFKNTKGNFSTFFLASNKSQNTGHYC